MTQLLLAEAAAEASEVVETAMRVNLSLCSKLGARANNAQPVADRPMNPTLVVADMMKQT
jgi:hypothetical protein